MPDDVRVASGKYDPRISFRSDQSDTWRQRGGGGTGLTLTAGEHKLAGALKGSPQPEPEPAPPARPRLVHRIEAAKPARDACPGECNKRYRDAWQEYAQFVEGYDPLDSAQSRPESPELGYWPGEPVWCAECTTRITLRLAQLDYLAGILAATADGHRPSGALERVSGSAEPPSPSPAADDLDEMFVMLSNWEAIYRALKGWNSGPPYGELASRETECINWLQRHLRGILCSDVGADFGREIIQWHREGSGSAKAGVRTLRKPLRCPSCKLVTLFWTEGEKQIRCKNDVCGRILSLSEYETEVERQAAILKRGQEDAGEDGEHEEDVA